MKRKIRLLAWTLVILMGTAFIIGAGIYFKSGGSPWQETPEISAVVVDVADMRKSKLSDSKTDFGDATHINVLVLGLDGRKGVTEPHCDAIHMFSLDIENWTIEVTSVPRGTYAYIPPGNYASNEYYLANACSFAGLDYGIEQIEKIIGVKADYRVTAGFSQVLGILRIFDLPTTDSLQWLRHRRGYAIGDPQRSHNQAVFMKDFIVNEGGRLRNEAAKSLFYVVYSIIDTDMDFGTARALLDGYLAADIDKRPDDIVLNMKPYYETQDLHLNLENPDVQVQALVDFLKPRTSKEDLSDKPLSDFQNDLITYIELQLKEKSVAGLFNQQLWLQVEDHDKREEFHFRFLEKYSLELINEDKKSEAIDLISGYISEKETLGEEQSVKLGRGLMANVVQ